MSDDLLDLYANWACNVSFTDLPSVVVEQAKNQVISTLAAIFAGRNSEEGHRISAAIHASQATASGPLTKAYTMAAWSMVHDYDDVMLGGHTGHSSVIVPLTLSLTKRATGRDLILAQVVTNEIAARINMACALGQTRGQMASHLHLIGAAVARAKFEKLQESRFSQVLSFALSSPGKLSLPAFLGSDAKFFCASWPLRNGWEAIDYVQAGLATNADTFDGKGGFLRSHAPHAIDGLLGGLGKQWFTCTNSFKPYPACGYLNGAIDCILEILRDHEPDAEQIEQVIVNANVFTYGVEQYARRYLRGPESCIAALTFSASFTIASCLIYGELVPANFETERLRNQRVWDLAGRVRIRHSMRQTRQALFSGIPIGVALTNAPWRVAWRFLRGFTHLVFASWPRWQRIVTELALLGVWCRAPREPMEPLDALTKPLGAEVIVNMSNRTAIRRRSSIPRGFAGREDWRSVRSLMNEKFRTCAKPVIGEHMANDSLSVLDRLESASAEEIQRLSPFLRSEVFARSMSC